MGIRSEEKFAGLSSKTNNIRNTKTKFSVTNLFNKCESKSAVLCGYVHIYKISS